MNGENIKRLSTSKHYQVPGSSSPSEHVAELQRSVETYLAQCHDNYNMSGICEVNNLLKLSFSVIVIVLCGT